MKYTDKERIERIVSTARKLLDYLEVSGISKEDVLNQEPLRWTITTPLYNIGEHVYNLTDEFKEAHADIPWAKISGLRHRLVHDYENTNWTLISAVLFDELPGFLREIEAIIL